MAVSDNNGRRLAALNDTLDMKARQLRALLAMSYGEGNIRVMSDELQDQYLWACSDMADDIVKALDQINELSSSVEVQHG